MLGDTRSVCAEAARGMCQRTRSVLICAVDLFRVAGAGRSAEICQYALIRARFGRRGARACEAVGFEALRTRFDVARRHPDLQHTAAPPVCSMLQTGGSRALAYEKYEPLGAMTRSAAGSMLMSNARPVMRSPSIWAGTGREKRRCTLRACDDEISRNPR